MLRSSDVDTSANASASYDGAVGAVDAELAADHSGDAPGDMRVVPVLADPVRYRVPLMWRRG